MKRAVILFFGCLIPLCGWTQSALDRADRHIAQLDYQRAIQVLEKSLEKEYQDILALRLGFVYWQTGQVDQAQYWYRQAIRSKDTQAIDYLRFAQLLASANNCGEAEDWYARFLEAAPFDRRAQKLQDLCSYQDSLKAKNYGFFELQNAAINTEYADRTAFFTKEGLWFASERPYTGPVEQLQAQNDQPFADLYWIPFADNLIPSWPLNPNLNNPVREPSPLNTALHESNPSWCPSTRELYFSRSARMDGKVQRDLDGFVPLEIVYVSQNRDGTWGSIKRLPFSTSAYNFLHPAVHPSGEWLLFSSDLPGGYGGMDLYISHRTRWGWGSPINLGPAVNTEGQELFPAWWPNEVLCFASDGHPGLGGLDVFRSERLANYEWSLPENWGAPINSEQDDFSWQVFDTSAVSVISSNRKGNDDLYWVRRIAPEIHFRVTDQKTGREIPEVQVTPLAKNVEPEVGTHFLQQLNTCATYRISAPGYREQNFEWCTYLNQAGAYVEQAIRLEPNPEVELVGVAFDQGTGLPLNGVQIELEAFCEDQQSQMLTDLTGRFRFVLQAGCCYRIRGKKDGFLTALEEQVCVSATSNDSLFRKKLYLQPIVFTGRNSPWNSIAVKSGTYQDERTGFWMDALTGLPANGAYPDGRTYEAGQLLDRGPQATTLMFAKGRSQARVNEPIPFLLNIYYDLNQSSVRTDAQPELQRLLRMLEENPRYRIEIGAHTDSRGGRRYNQKLSQRRAEAVVEWLIRQGVPAYRLVARGYGESRLTNRCSDGQKCAEWQHQMNRRTEFRVIAVQ